MEELIDLLSQIQELAGVGLDALNEALGGGGGETSAPEGGEAPNKPPQEGAAPPPPGA